MVLVMMAMKMVEISFFTPHIHSTLHSQDPWLEYIPKVLECEMSREYVSIITWTVLESSPTVLGVSFRNRTGRTSE